MRRQNRDGVRVEFPEIGQPGAVPVETCPRRPNRPRRHRLASMRRIVIAHHNGLTVADRAGPQQDRGVPHISNHRLLASGEVAQEQGSFPHVRHRGQTSERTKDKCPFTV